MGISKLLKIIPKEIYIKNEQYRLVIDHSINRPIVSYLDYKDDEIGFQVTDSKTHNHKKCLKEMITILKKFGYIENEEYTSK